MNNSKNGITLVSLIITVIVMIILAGTAISLAINQEDLFGKSKNAVVTWNNSLEKETIMLNSVNNTLLEGNQYIVY